MPRLSVPGGNYQVNPPSGKYKGMGSTVDISNSPWVNKNAGFVQGDQPNDAEVASMYQDLLSSSQYIPPPSQGLTVGDFLSQFSPVPTANLPLGMMMQRISNQYPIAIVGAGVLLIVLLMKGRR